MPLALLDDPRKNVTIQEQAKQEAREVRSALESTGDDEWIFTAKASAAIYVPTGTIMCGNSTNDAPSNPHPLIQAGYVRYHSILDQNRGVPLSSNPLGVCAEVNAVNKLLHALAKEGIKITSLEDIEVVTVSVDQLKIVDPCLNCEVVLDGLKFKTS